MNSKLKLILFSLSIIFVSAARRKHEDAQSPPEFTKFSEEDVLIREGLYKASIISIPCEAKGNPEPSYYWTKNGKLLNWTSEDQRISKIPGKGTLVIDGTKDSDVGQYQCFAKNNWGTATSNSVFVRKAQLSLFQNKPTVLKTVTEGQPFGFPCQIPNGYPKPHIYWLIQDSTGLLVTLNDSRITVDPEGTLWFSNTTQKDSSQDSVYSCVATSASLNHVTLGNRIKLEVIPKNSSSEPNSIAPVKQYTSQKIEMAISENTVSLYCIFGGTPLPTITWYKNGELIQFNGNVSLTNYGKSLLIKHITSADEGNYTCHASNGVGDPISHTTILKTLAKPTFTKTPTSAIKTENETVEFHCEAAGNPTPEITWIHNGRPLSEAPFNPRRVVSSNSIIIENLQKSDTGNYGCNATNSLGYVYKDVFINVLA